MQIIRPLALSLTDYTTDVAETETDWLVGTTYALNDEVRREHKLYISTIASNTGNDPLLENQLLTSTKWLFKGYTNAFKFIDGTIGNKTEATTSVVITVANVTGIEALLMVGMRAVTVQVQGFDSGPAEVYNQTISLSGRSVYTFYAWFTEPIGEGSNKVIVNDFPNDVDSLTVTVVGSTIEIGEMMIGDILEVGTCMYEGTEGEVKSYSRYEFNDYGNLVQIKGPTRTIMRYGAHVPRISFSLVKEQMDKLAGDVVGAIGSPTRASTVQMGVLGTIRWAEDLPNDYKTFFQLDGVT